MPEVHRGLLVALYLLRQCYAELLAFVAISCWALLAWWNGSKLGLGKRVCSILVFTGLAFWSLPFLLRHHFHAADYKGGGFSATWGLLLTAAVLVGLYARSPNKLKRILCVVLFLVPVLGAVTKLSCYFVGCCSMEPSLAFGALTVVPDSYALSTVQDPVQLYEAASYLLMQGLFFAILRRYGCSYRTAMSMFALLAFNQLVLLWFRDGLSASRVTAVTFLHSPIVAVVVLVGCAVALVAGWNSKSVTGEALKWQEPGPDKVSFRWHVLVVVPLTVFVAIRVSSQTSCDTNVLDEQVDVPAVSTKAGDPVPPPCGRFADGWGEAAVLAANYNRFSGAFSWRRMVRFLRGRLVIQEFYGGQVDYAPWPSCWHTHPYKQLHVSTLIDAYRFSNDTKFLRQAASDVNCWLWLIPEEAIGNVLWPDNREAVMARTLQWVLLLRELRSRSGQSEKGFVRRLADRLIFYAEWLMTDAKKAQGSQRARMYIVAAYAAASCPSDDRTEQIIVRGIARFAEVATSLEDGWEGQQGLTGLVKDLKQLLREHPNPQAARIMKMIDIHLSE